MTTLDRIRSALSESTEDVFLRAEFRPYGGTRQVSKALKILVEQGELVKLGVGVFARAKASVLTGKPIPVKALEFLIPDVLAKLGIQILPSQLVQHYNQGISRQIPAGITFRIRRRRFTRKLGFNGKVAKFELT